LNKIIFGEITSGKFQLESGEIQFLVPVLLELEKGFEIPVPD
jgi:hypothetical protein